MYALDAYDYELPPDLIAQVPASERDNSRLFVVERKREEDFRLGLFHDLPRFLREGDLLVVNDSRVVPARLFGKKATGGDVEVLVLPKDASEGDPFFRSCLIRASKRPRPGAGLSFEGGLGGEVKEVLGYGMTRIAFRGVEDLDAYLEERGAMPLPPYIKRRRGDPLGGLDRERYQTVFSRVAGSAAAPTAGLHFTGAMLQGLGALGIEVASVTLHVGYGTFQPVRATDIRAHRLHREFFRIPRETVEAICRTRKRGGRVVAVGTTVVRTLESAADLQGSLSPCEGETGLLITPGHAFKAVDALITNFHLPRSSLLFLVAAFAGYALTLKAYRRAVSERFRFFSYGDAMLIL